MPSYSTTRPPPSSPHIYSSFDKFHPLSTIPTATPQTPPTPPSLRTPPQVNFRSPSALSATPPARPPPHRSSSTITHATASPPTSFYSPPNPTSHFRSHPHPVPHLHVSPTYPPPPPPPPPFSYLYSPMSQPPHTPSNHAHPPEHARYSPPAAPHLQVPPASSPYAAHPPAPTSPYPVGAAPTSPYPAGPVPAPVSPYPAPGGYPAVPVTYSMAMPGTPGSTPYASDLPSNKPPMEMVTQSAPAPKKTGSQSALPSPQAPLLLLAVGGFKDIRKDVQSVPEETITSIEGGAKRLHRLKEKLNELQEIRSSYWNKQGAAAGAGAVGAVLTLGVAVAATGATAIHNRNRLEQVKKSMRDVIQQINKLRSVYAHDPTWSKLDSAVVVNAVVFTKGIDRNEIWGEL